MGLSLSVNGDNIKFDLKDYEIKSYDFIYSAPNSQYAKGHEDERYLKITGDISRIIEKNKDILEIIRNWAKTEYTDESHYIWVKITETYRENVIREITFPDAFIKNYSEEIDPNTGHGKFVLLLMQKMDKRIHIVMDPFNEKFPSLADLMNPESDINKIAAALDIAPLTAAALLLNSDLFAYAGIEDILNGLSECSKDPVNLATGNFLYIASDISIDGAFPLNFYRFYNAIDEYNGALGFNWHHSYEIKMVDLEDGSKEIIFEDGHREKYTPDEKGVFTAPVGVHKGLYENSDNEGPEKKYILKLADGSRYEFDEQGHVILKTDMNDNRTEFAYDNGLLIGVSTLSGSLSFIYSSNGLIDVITDNAGRKITYRYADGNLADFTDANGNTYKYKYDIKTNRLISVTNPLGNRMVYNSYDNSARTTMQSFPDGGRMEYIYSNETLTTTLTERSSNRIVYHYDENYRIYRVEYTDGSVEKIFDADNNLTQYTDKMSNVWSYEYDLNGNRTKEIDPLGNVTEYRYGISNKLTRTIKANGAEISNRYDSKGNLIKRIDELGSQIQIEYNEFGLPIVLANERNHNISSAYDKSGNKISETDALGNSSAYEYDNLNRLVKVTLPEGNTRSFEYTNSGKIKRVFGGDGEVMGYTYDSADNVIEIKDFAGNKTTFKYNEMNRPVKKINALGGICLYEYDYMWNIVRETDENGGSKVYEYDKLNRLSAKIDEKGNRTEYSYDRNGNVVKETDPLGQETAFRYDALNRRTLTENKNRSKSTVIYDAVGNIIKTTDFIGHESAFEYDLAGRLLKSIDALGGQTVYSYDESGNTTSVVNPMGYITKYEYNARNKVTAIINPLGGRTEVSYDKNGNVKQAVNSEGGKTDYRYDKNDRLISFTNPEGYNFSFQYDTNGNRVAAIDGRDNKRTFAYDALNRMTSVTDEGGCTNSVIYDPKGRIVKLTNADGAITHYERDANGNIVKVTDALGNSTKLEYDALNRIAKRLEANGAETAYEYNALDLVVSIKDAEGGATLFEYDKNGNILKETNAENESYCYKYNALGQITTVTNPLGFRDSFSYDATGKITSVTDKNSNITSYKYDGNGNVIETIDALGHSSYFEYDTMNRLIKMRLYRIDAENSKGEEQLTLYQYDSRGLMTKVINNAGDEKLLVYDENGNLIQKTDEDGYVTEYSYNSKNLVKLINYSNEKKVYFEYNKSGKLVEVHDWTGKNTFELDALHRIVSVNDHNNKVVRYMYDEVGNRTQIHYPDETTVTYKFDLLKRIVEASDTGNSITSYQYDKVGRKVGMKYPNGISESYLYNTAGQLLKVTGTDVRNSEYLLNKYEYDPQGNITWEFKRDMGGNKHHIISYGYDANNRLTLTKEMHRYFDRNYQYDSLGNLTSENGKNSTVKYSIDGLNRLVSKNTSKNEVYNYIYDKRGNLVQETNGVTNAVMASYIYDVTNRMVKGTNKSDESSVYNYNGLGILINNTTDINKDFVIDYTAFAPRELLELQDNGLNYRYVYGGRNRISANISKQSENVTMYYHSDRLGSIVYLTDGLGKIQAMANYDEWGNRSKVKSASLLNAQLDLAKSYSELNFDNILNIYYARSRFYDAKKRKMLSKDKYWNAYNTIYGDTYSSYRPKISISSLQQASNLYAYVLNNPLIYIDLEGFRTYLINGINNPNTTFPENMHNLGVELGNQGIKDIRYLTAYAETNVVTGTINAISETVNIDQYTDQFVKQILEDLKNNPLTDGEELNLIGYSGGGILAINVAKGLGSKKVTEMKDYHLDVNGFKVPLTSWPTTVEYPARAKIDNIVLIGSPVNKFDNNNTNQITDIWSSKDILSKKTVFWSNVEQVQVSSDPGHTEYFCDPHLDEVVKIIAERIN